MKKEKPRKEREKKPPEQPTERERESDDIERAVYDGMQDLRQEKPEPKR